MTAILRDTPSQPVGPLAHPGEYTVKLTVNSKSFTQPLTLKMDPRVMTPAAGLDQQFRESLQTYQAMQRIHETLQQIRRLRPRVKELRDRAGPGALDSALDSFGKRLVEFEGGGRFGGGNPNEVSLSKLHRDLFSLLDILQGADVAPTMQALAAARELQQSFEKMMARWDEAQEKDLKSINDQLQKASLPLLK
jgi:hypothetical protein